MIPDLVLSVAAAIFGNIAASVVRAIKSFVEARRKLAEVKETQFASALNSDSLKVLGAYLDGPIASFAVKEYAHNRDVRERVNTFLARLEDFVGARDEPRESLATPEARPLPPELADPELARIETQIEEGHLWDALAALRRTIELRLAGLASEHGVAKGPGQGAGRLLSVLSQRGIIAPDLAEGLRYAVNVANRGVHGLDVTTDETVSALAVASRALEQLGLASRTARPNER
jgi:hypothetical protein